MSSRCALVLVTATTTEAISRTEMKTWLKIDESEVAEDGLIDSLITMARKRYAEYTKRNPLKETFDYYLDEFPDVGAAIELPRAPLASISSIKGFTDTDGTDTGGTSMNSSEYYVDTAREPGRVVPLQSATWPVATRVVNAGIIRFVAGHSSGSSGVPDQVKTQLKRMVAHAFEHRGDVAPESAMDEILVEDELDLSTWG